ncbi:MAG: hypothetical protein JWR44_1625 [Hymenobacter sp.]|jgi:hypothetical protein|nr:hypothetical protein [Hymenobacter sp.]
MKFCSLVFLVVALSAGFGSGATDFRKGVSAGKLVRRGLTKPASNASPLPVPSALNSASKPVSSPFPPATLRRHYEQAAADKVAGEKFYKLLANYNDRDALVLGYKAAAEAIRARDASMFNKLTYVQDAARTFEQAVSLDPQNPEIRFLRFSVESNLPAFLGLSKHVDEDKELLLNAALTHPKSGLDAEAFRTMRSFLVDRGHVSDEQAQRLSRMAE